MKNEITKLLLIALMTFSNCLVHNFSYCQAPHLFNYQGIARDAKGNPLSNQMMSLKLSILSAADAIEAEYEETQLITTNEFGLYTLQIGNGTAVRGDMKTVKWETGNKYIKVAIDPTGGSDYADAGTSQLLSVPYAIYADRAGATANENHDKTRTGAVSSNATHIAGDANYHTKFTALNTIGKSLIYDNGTNMAIGTASPLAKFHISQNVASVQEHIRMQNLSSTGAGRFTMYNDLTSSYTTFTKYGSAYAGGYIGVASLYPYANLLAFGNNGIAAGDGTGRFLVSSAGNIGISLAKSGTSKLKFHADFTSENVGIGGNATPVSRVHLNNTDGTSMTARLTNNTTGHTATDGLELSNVGNAASIINKENSTLSLGTNNAARMTIAANGNVGIGTATPADDALHIKRSYSSIRLEDSNDNASLYIIAPDPTNNGTGGIGTTTNHDLPLFTNNADRLIIKNNGKIGINTFSPVTHLHVNGDIKADTVYATKIIVDTIYATYIKADTIITKNIKDSSHYIGELYGGGIVFYVWKDSNRVEHGFIASLMNGPTSDWLSAQIWCTSLVTNVNCNTCSPWAVPDVVTYSLLSRAILDIRRVLGNNNITTDIFWSAESCCGNGGGRFNMGNYLQLDATYEINTAQHPVRAVRTF